MSYEVPPDLSDYTATQSSSQEQKPDLVAYFSLDVSEGQETTDYKNSERTPVSRISSRNLYAEPNLKYVIGETTSTFQRFPNGDTRIDANWSFGFGVINTISYYQSPQFANFKIKPNNNYSFPILAANGDLINIKGGKMMIKNDDTRFIKVEFYLNK